jgi:hypothetical protein
MTDDMPIKKMQLERLILMALQRFEQQTGAAVESVKLTGGFVAPEGAPTEYHVLTQVRIVLHP